MELRLTITENYLCLPVKTADKENQQLKKLEIFKGEEQIFEFQLPSDSNEDGAPFDYLAAINTEAYKGQELCLKGQLSPWFFKGVCQKKTNIQSPIERPELHFSADRGWINDPNGLVYHDGIYHLYFQYNPFNTEWENMSWGSAVSRDLIHWEQLDTVLWPDETGTMFSGSAIVNDRGLLGLDKTALIYFYTAAGGAGDWSAGAGFTQRIAYSTDGGKTLVKYPQAALEVICKDSRDPKVFWHEASGAYIMVLWLQGNEFGIFRSEDLLHWENSQTLTLPEAWECPDLVELAVEDGSRQWIFWCADGYYYFGDFDGYQFRQTGNKKNAYGTKLPYAAQTYSGVEGRVITLPWLRTQNQGRLYTGIMGIPRELTLTAASVGSKLRMRPVKEYEALKVPAKVSGDHSYENTENEPFELRLTWEENAAGESKIALLAGELLVEPAVGRLRFGEEEFVADMVIRQLTIIEDRGIIEITANNDIIYLAFETSAYELTGRVSVWGNQISSMEVSRISKNG